MEQGKLKPCPFCGGEAETFWAQFATKLNPEPDVTVRCTKCDVINGWYRTPKQAADVWNIRMEVKNEV